MLSFTSENPHCVCGDKASNARVHVAAAMKVTRPVMAPVRRPTRRHQILA